jgi:hypothetical protein
MPLDGKGNQLGNGIHAVRRYARMALHGRLERRSGSRADVEHGLRVTSSMRSARRSMAQVWPPSSLSRIAS